MRTRFIAVAVAGVLAAACSDANTPTAPGGELEQPLASLSDGNHGSSRNPDFFFLPPITQRAGPFSGVFDGDLDPVVDICKLDLTGACAGPVAHFTTWSSHGRGESERVRVDGNHYEVNWHTRDSHLDQKYYRICVSVGPNTLGHADVAVFRKDKERKTIDKDQYVPVENGSTLPIKFRIEQGAGAFVDAGCRGALLPAEIHGRKCLVTGEHDEDDDRDGHDEDDDHEDVGRSSSASHTDGAHDDHGDGHDDHHDGHDDHDEHEGHDGQHEQRDCDDESAGIKDWPISLYQGSSLIPTTVTTDANGNYSFTGLQPGTYTVCEGVLTGFEQVFPQSGADCPGGTHGYQLTLGSGQVAKHKDFGNKASAPPPVTTATLTGKVTTSGLVVSVVSGLAIFDGSGTLVATTGLDGVYTITGLTPGSYTVCAAVPPPSPDPWVLLDPAATATCLNGTQGYSLTLFAGTNPPRDFIFQQAG